MLGGVGVLDVGVVFVVRVVRVSIPAGRRFSWDVGGFVGVWGIKNWVVGLDGGGM